jgi:hypothetical protein
MGIVFARRVGHFRIRIEGWKFGSMEAPIK